MFHAQIVFSDNLCKGRIVYDNIAKLHNEIIQSLDDTISLSITTEGRFGRTFLFLIPCLQYLATQHNKQIKISVSKTIYENLGRLSFIDTKQTVGIGSGVKMRFVRLETDEKVLDLAKGIVEEMPVALSPRLQEDMVSRIGEIFNNAHYHSDARYVLGGRYPKAEKRICLACYDTGIGIPERVRRFFNSSVSVISDETALRWAMAPFHSTAARENEPKGHGFNLLKNFALLNHGVIRVCTGNILYTYDCKAGDSGKEKFQKLKYSFKGTLFEMDINSDERLYSYKGESV